jgi:regulation of enolase protein 1 (concanavalin A-like superfamily)
MKSVKNYLLIIPFVFFAMALCAQEKPGDAKVDKKADVKVDTIQAEGKIHQQDKPKVELPAPDADGWWTIRAERGHDSVQLWSGDQPIRLAPFPAGELQSGPMCAAPKGPGFSCSFAPLT